MFRLKAIQTYFEKLAEGDAVALGMTFGLVLLAFLLVGLGLYFRRQQKKEDERWKNRWYKKK